MEVKKITVNTYVVEVTRHEIFRFIIEAENEEQAESDVDAICENSLSDLKADSKDVTYSRAEAVGIINAIIEDSKNDI